MDETSKYIAAILYKGYYRLVECTMQKFQLIEYSNLIKVSVPRNVARKKNEFSQLQGRMYSMLWPKIYILFNLIVD